MFLLLLTLLVIAITITLAGLVLSSKAPTSRQQEVPYATGRSVTTHQVRARSYVVRSEMLRNSSTTRAIRGTQSVGGRRSLAYMLPAINIGGSVEGSMGRLGPWLGVVLILLALFGFCCFALNAVLLHPGLVFNSSLPDSAASATAVAAPPAPVNPFIGLAGASKALTRVYQLDPAQYASSQEYSTWAYAACSAASMTEVINSYGHHYRLTDVLNVETHLNQITPDLGLLQPTGIDLTVAKFGFKTVHFSNHSLDDVVHIADQGRPVIVSFPPSRWDGGHILVVRGGTSQNVYLADSSRLNMQIMPRATFLKYWGGFAVVVIPA